MSTIGFLSGMSASAGSQPPERGSAHGSARDTLPADHSDFRRVLYSPGFVNGMQLGRDCIVKERSAAKDMELLLNELFQARPGPPRNYAEGRLAGFMFEVDAVLDAVRANVRITIAPIDREALIEQLEGR